MRPHDRCDIAAAKIEHGRAAFCLNGIQKRWAISVLSGLAEPIDMSDGAAAKLLGDLGRTRTRLWTVAVLPEETDSEQTPRRDAAD